ncbi:hypothetical protein SAMN05192560_0757 [Methylobacillus rhizosphaerae]|uniref:RNA helicase n=1 Tax=Methylobacillus rhizosphaerae TaxID=551994 RepID=A0A238YQN0_9PROT|nr:hypothetical protein [Methylobacillus rhizosphaerae]SNR73445.1 hypothetical protein SAMN05192560_0757 [Methylobacillus rhizosphaerae]
MIDQEQKQKEVCGVIMPISEIDGCNSSHWLDVKDIIYDAIRDSGFEPNLVSDATDVGLIQKRIVQNLYENPIVVCDVSGKNPNVMFELGMRLAFDKPTIIIKDDKTSYSFDTAGIEHLEYPRDLRFAKITDFKEKLSEKIQATYSKSESNDGYTTFLKNFGEFKVAKIDQKEVPIQDYILEELQSIRAAISKSDKSRMFRGSYYPIMKVVPITFDVSNESNMVRARILSWAISHPDVDDALLENDGIITVLLRSNSSVSPESFSILFKNMIITLRTINFAKGSSFNEKGKDKKE